MSLEVKLLAFQGTGTCGDRIAKATFKGVSHLSKIFEDQGDWTQINEKLLWPLASPLQRNDQMEIQILAFNRFLNNRLLGTTNFSLHRLLDQSVIQLSATILDLNGIPSKSTIKIEINYRSPLAVCDDDEDSSLNSDDEEEEEEEEEAVFMNNIGASNTLPDSTFDDSALLSIEQNIANIERSIITNNSKQKKARDIENHHNVRFASMSRSTSLGASTDSSRKKRGPFAFTNVKKRVNPLKSVRNAIRTMGGNRSRSSSIDEDERGLIRSVHADSESYLSDIEAGLLHSSSHHKYGNSIDTETDVSRATSPNSLHSDPKHDTKKKKTRRDQQSSLNEIES